jgi:hypothetical protein
MTNQRSKMKGVWSLVIYLILNCWTFWLGLPSVFCITVMIWLCLSSGYDTILLDGLTMHACLVIGFGFSFGGRATSLYNE